MTFYWTLLIPLSDFATQTSTEYALIDYLSNSDWVSLGFPTVWSTEFSGPNLVSGSLNYYVDSDGLPNDSHPNVDAQPLAVGHYANIDWRTGGAYSASTLIVQFTINFEMAILADAATLGPDFVNHITYNVLGGNCAVPTRCRRTLPLRAVMCCPSPPSPQDHPLLTLLVLPSAALHSSGYQLRHR